MGTIDWDALRKRMMVMKYQPAYFSAMPPVSNWILALGVWDDSKEWIDTETWTD